MRGALVALVASSFALGCSTANNPPAERTERLVVTVRLPSGDPLPQVEEPPLALPPGLADLDFDVQAQRADGSFDPSFEGFVRISSVPGAIAEISGDRASGRSVLLLQGQALNQRARIRNARGETRIWAEDIGYIPGDPSDPAAPPSCSNGLDDDDDGDVDFPLDPGCAFANDTTENAGTYAAGVSEPVRFARPRLADVQGLSANTPYELESVEIESAQPGAELIVTRISGDGFYVSDLAETRGYGHIFAFTFNAPPGLRECDRITKLAGTSVEFFGFTELSFPSFDRHAWRFPIIDENGTIIDLRDGPCLIPEPRVITDDAAIDNPVLEQIESSLVRIENVTVGAYFGPEPVPGPGQFSANASNCDLDGSGFIDFDTPNSNEAQCANACGDNVNCVEWTAFISRGNYRVVTGANSIQINTRAISGFDPVSMRGKQVRSVTGTLRNFSGGALNWTIESRCGTDLVCDDPSQVACVEGPQDPVSSQIACIKQRTTDELEGQD